MKKLFCLLMLAAGLVSCNDEKHVWVFEDMMYFLDNGTHDEGYLSPVTNLTVAAPSQVQLLVMRNGFAAEKHPKQTVRITVEENLSTAKLGADFSIDQQVLQFQKKSTMQLPLQVNIHGGTSGKKIVLQLDYGYHDECSPDGRKADKLTIKIK